jgi:hypothetical protein
MRLFDNETFTPLLEQQLSKLLHQAEEAKISTQALADLLSVPAHVLYAVKRDGPGEKFPAIGFMNALIANKIIRQALDEGTLPATRAKMKEWVDSYKPAAE